MADDITKTYLNEEGLQKYDLILKNRIFGDWEPGDEVPTSEPDIILPVDKGGTGATTEEEARKNIGAVSEDDVTDMIGQALAGGGLDDSSVFLKTTDPVIRYTSQNLTSNQKTQARTNIDAASSSHSHKLTDSKISGILPVSKGGTDRTEYGSEGSVLVAGPGGDSIMTVSPLPVIYGGTGATTMNDARTNLGFYTEIRSFSLEDGKYAYENVIQAPGTVVGAFVSLLNVTWSTPDGTDILSHSPNYVDRISCSCGISGTDPTQTMLTIKRRKFVEGVDSGNPKYLNGRAQVLILYNK
jgi:hypothetical protein